MAWDDKIVNKIIELIDTSSTQKQVFKTSAEQHEYSHAIKYMRDIMLDAGKSNDDPIASLETKLTRFFRIRPNQFNKIPSPVSSVYNLLIENKSLNTEKLTQEEALMTEVLAFVFKNEPQKIDDKDECKELVDRSSSTIYSTASDAKSGIKTLGANLESFPWNYSGYDGHTYLHKAAEAGNIDLVTQLIAIDYVALNLITTFSGSTPLFYAIKNGHADVVATLCAHKNTKVNMKTRRGEDPLTWAMTHIKNNDRLIASLLAHKEIDFTSIEKYLGKDIYAYAMEKDNECYVDAIELNIGEDAKKRVNEYPVDLFKCIKMANADGLLKEMLQEVENDTSNIEGFTVLQIAAIQGDEKSVGALLKYGADPKMIDNDGNTALSFIAGLSTAKLSLIAALSNAEKATYPAIVKLLLDAMDADTVNKSTQDGETALSRAISAGNADIMRLIYSSEKCNLFLYEDCHDNFLHRAAENGWFDDLSHALATPAGKNLVNSTDPAGCTPLHLAAIEGHRDIVEMLLDNNADAGKKNIFRHTALTWVARDYQYTKRGEHLSIASLLLDHMTVEQVNCLFGGDKTTLKVAIDNGNDGIVSLICASEKCNLLLEKDNSYNFLHHAAKTGLTVDFAYALATRAGKKLINSTDSTSDTPLHYAARKGHVDIVKMLLDNGADVGKQNNCMNTALSLSAGRDKNCENDAYVTTVSMLLKRMTVEQVNFPCQGEKTALQWAIDNGNDGIVSLICASEKCNLLLEKDNSYNFLHHAAKTGLTVDFAYALATRAGKWLINSTDSTSDTPLHYAARKGHVDIVKMLLDNGADVGKQNNCMNTALSLSAGRDKNCENDAYVTTVSMLLKRMTVEQVNFPCQGEKTALQWAQQQGHISICTLISDFLDKNNSEIVNQGTAGKPLRLSTSKPDNNLQKVTANNLANTCNNK